jgi:phage terminase small subunit
MALTARQQAFVVEYLNCLNATEAAKRAGYGEAGASVRGHENLRHPEIKKAIEQHFSASVMTAEEALALFSEQARAEYSKYFREDGSVDLAKMIRDGKGHLIKSIKDTKYGKYIEFHDPVSARETLARILGLLDRGRTLEEPEHVVQWTVEEWKAEQAKRRQQAAEIEEVFEDD